MKNKKIKVMLVFGTRPEAIKMAPVIKTLINDENFTVKVVVTAQHREILDQVLDLFEIKPDYDLNVMQAKQSLTGLTNKILEGLDDVFEIEKPDIVLVHGDTTTTFVASIAAFYNKIPVGHIEAGLRTFNKKEPFPEEINRRLTTTLADIHFAPTLRAKSNLILEGVEPELVFVTGNTVIDALLPMRDENYEFQDPVLRNLDYTKPILLSEAHRRENLGEPLKEILSALKTIVLENTEVELIYSVHPNPLVKDVVFDILGNQERIHLIQPPSYKEWINLMQKSFLLLTDSGGLQEEAPSLELPVLVLREVTERPEGIQTGTLKLVGTDRHRIISETQTLLLDKQKYRKMKEARNPYGDGFASLRIRDALLFFFNKGKKPLDFSFT